MGDAKGAASELTARRLSLILVYFILSDLSKRSVLEKPKNLRRVLRISDDGLSVKDVDLLCM